MSKKKMYLLIGLAVMVAAGVWFVPKFRLPNLWLDGKWEEVVVGDLEIPVSASGTVVGEDLVEIKPKASGEVTEILVKEGMMVHAGDLLVKLDPVDETRNLERAQADLDRAEAAWEQSKIRLDEAQKNRPLDINMAQARVAQMAASMKQAELEVRKLKDVSDKTEIEVERATANFNGAKATYDQAVVDLDRAKNTSPIAIRTAEQDVKVAKAVFDMAVKTVDETRLRLKETNIFSPIDGMIYAIRIAKGNIVQSGKTSLTGGTPLLTIANNTKMYVVAQVDEADIGSVRKIAPAFARPGQTRIVSDEELLAAPPSRNNAEPTPRSAASAPSTQPNPEDVALARNAEAALVGQRVSVTVEAYRDETYEGVIERILPEPRSVSNVVTFDVRIRLIGADLQKLQGLQADVQFTSDRVLNVLKVKNEALVSEGKECFVYVPFRESDNVPWDEKKVAVKIGLTDGTFTQIREGLQKGERVWVKRPVKTEEEKAKEKKD